MPFTFSHPAIVIPLKRWFSLTGLIIGSMSPDFEYFINMKISNIHGHTIKGILYYDLPISVLIAFLFHNIIRYQLITNLPSSINCRFSQYLNFNWNKYFKENYLIIIISFIIGIGSHILWDSFTHESGYFVNKLQLLRKSIFINNFNIPLYKIVQHLSTFLGGLLLFYYYLNLPKRHSNSIFFNAKYWISIIVISMLIIFGRLYYFHFNLAIGNLIVTSIPSVFCGILITSLFNLKKFNYK